MPNDWEDQLKAALRSGDNDKTWEAYKQAWNSGATPDMDAKIFMDLFYDGGISEEAVQIVKDNPNAWPTITQAAIRCELNEILSDVDLSRVFLALWDFEAVIDSWKQWRENQSLDKRSTFIYRLVDKFTSHYGREWIRKHIFSLLTGADKQDREL